MSKTQKTAILQEKPMLSPVTLDWMLGSQFSWIARWGCSLSVTLLPTYWYIWPIWTSFFTKNWCQHGFGKPLFVLKLKVSVAGVFEISPNREELTFNSCTILDDVEPWCYTRVQVSLDSINSTFCSKTITWTNTITHGTFWWHSSNMTRVF